MGVFTFLYMILLIAFSLSAGSMLTYLVGVNIIAFIFMGYDKFSARKQKSRIPERFLLTMCALGGSAGCILSMFIFRHKTQKYSFNLPVIGIFLIQLLLAYMYKRMY